ncbi:S24 family peptidase [Nitrosophilus alvini]|uniref:S24 family peptidase n=1 Tax=Nitrosophilus alvini TaxID=2714855 RepID=UPI00190D3F50|nr:S24 family peptidase [Nitrosophilus alvini]
MLSFDEVTERVKDILSKELGERKIYDKDVAKVLGVTPEYFSMMKKRKRLPIEELANFCAARNISINWLLYDQNPASLCEPTEKFAYVKYFKEINASAGGGALNYEESAQKLYLDPELIRFFGGEKRLKDIEALNVIGDSMEPLLKDGSIVFIDRSQKDIRKGGVFVISTNAGVFIKRVALKITGEIELISENRSYPKESVLPEEIKIIGKVMGALEKKPG